MLKHYTQDHPSALEHIHTDSGSWWLGHFSQFCRDSGTCQTFLRPYLQFQKQTAEQAVQLVKQSGCRSMLESGFDDDMWLYARKLTAVQNSQSMTSLDLVCTPLSKHYDDERLPHELIVMGSPTYTLIHKEGGCAAVLGMPAFVGHFVGFHPDSSRYPVCPPIADEEGRWQSLDISSKRDRFPHALSIYEPQKFACGAHSRLVQAAGRRGA